VRKPR